MFFSQLFCLFVCFAILKLPVFLSLRISTPLSLNNERTLALLVELASLSPTADALLQDEYLAREYLLAQLFEEHVLCVLEKHLALAELIVSVDERSAQARLAYASRRRCAVLHVRRFHVVDQEPIAIDKIGIRVAYRVAGAADAYRFHHARVAQLAYNQLSIKQL